MSQYFILIVDDELHTRELCSDFLSENGYAIETSENGKEALNLLSRKSFHILLSDIQMPEMDGIALLKESRKNYSQMEVILMTAYGGLPSAIEAIRFGAYDYITKPLSRDFLLNTIRRCIEKIELKRKLEESQMKLIEQEKLAALGSVSAWLSHRMRNSLSVISMCAHYLLEKSPALSSNQAAAPSSTASVHAPARGGDFREVLTAIIDKIKTVQKMTSDFIAYSRPYELQIGVENLNGLLTSVIESLHVQIQIQNVQLIKQLDPKLPDIQCDPHILKEAFENILLNALQAIGHQKNQLLIVQTEFLSMSPDSSSANKEKNKGIARMTISNTGSSISPENIEKIFIPFFTTKGEGSGLGLAIVKKIVEQHGGEVRAENEKRDGKKMCSFKMTFPV